MVGHGGSIAGSYLTDPTSPIPSHCASIVATSTLRVKKVLLCEMYMSSSVHENKGLACTCKYFILAIVIAIKTSVLQVVSISLCSVDKNIYVREISRIVITHELIFLPIAWQS